MASDAGGPVDIRFKSAVFDIDFHPKQDVLAVGLVSGKLEIHAYSSSSTRRVVAVQLHQDSLRSLRFTEDGQRLYSTSSDKSIKCMDTNGTVVWQKEGAHSEPVNVIHPVGSTMLFTGDDEGTVKAWDTRTAGGAPVVFTHHQDVVTCIAALPEKGLLVTASGDGRLGCVDLRKGKLASKTEQLDDEYLSLGFIKKGAKLVAGTQSGTLHVWDTNQLNESSASERFKGHPESVDAVLTVDEDTIITGSSDGIMRLVTIQPNKLVGVLGEHDDFPLERLAWSRDKRYVASSSHDELVKFWDLAYLFEDNDEEGSQQVSGRSKFVDMPELALPNAGAGEEEEDDDMSGDEDDDDDMDSDDDDDEEDDDDDEEEDDDGMTGGAAAGSESAGRYQRRAGGGGKSAAQRFFEDL